MCAHTYNRIIQKAQQNSLQTYKIFYYQGEEKLHILLSKRIKQQLMSDDTPATILGA